METRAFTVNEPRDLHALQRVFREAKFSDIPNDDEVSSSPVVAALYRQLLDVLIEAEVARSGESARARWQLWLQMDPGRDEWRAAMHRAKTCAKWPVWTDDERFGFVRLLFSPFLLGSELESKFVEEVSAHFEARS
jgi:hypothetical protein